MHRTYLHTRTVCTARSCSREGRDRPLAESCLNLLDFFLLISARCLPGCDEQHGHCNRPNECMWVYIDIHIYVYLILAHARMRMRVCVCVFICVRCTASYNRRLNSWAPTRCIHSSVCTDAAYACKRDNNYAHTYRKLSFDAVPKKAHGSAVATTVDPRHVTGNACSYAKNTYSGIILFSREIC